MTDCNVAGSTITGVFSLSGLKNGGLYTEVSINDAAWLPVPPTPMANRNAISIQNLSGVEIKLNYTTPVGYTGVVMGINAERFYDITDTIIVYARAKAGSGTVTIGCEELS